MPSYANNAVPSSTSKDIGVPSAKSEDVDMVDASMPFAEANEMKPTLYTVYNVATDISYAPEEALKTGLGMVKTIKENIKKLELGSKLRKDVWLREIERFALSYFSDHDLIAMSLVFKTKEHRPPSLLSAEASRFNCCFRESAI